MGWTPENIERVRTMAESGLSASQVAAAIGGVSRNAVVGVGMRNKITFHGRSGNRGKSEHATRARISKPKSLLAPMAPGETFPESLMVTFADLEPGACHFPFGHTDFRFCGLPTLEGRSYCRHHTIITTQPR